MNTPTAAPLIGRATRDASLRPAIQESEPSYGWLTARRVEQRLGLLRKDMADSLDYEVPRWNEAFDPEAEWLSRAYEHAVFVIERGHQPHEHSPIPAERSLGRWRGRQRRSAGLPTGRTRILDELVSGWRVGARTAKWETHRDNVVEFHRNRFRLPVEDSTDPEEVALARWLQKQCTFNRQGSLAAERIASLDDLIPGWQLRVAGNIWLQTATEVGDFAALNARFPTKNAAHTDERRLGAWLHNQRTRLGAVKPDHLAKAKTLEVLAPGWRTGK